MRALLVVGLILMSGCTFTTNEAPAEPGVSMSVHRSRNNSVIDVDATLTGVHGPIDDWSDLQVSGCSAPREGAIDIPHRFVSCGWDISIRYAPTGKVLYRTT